jgi:DNA-binding CsgD family transcriptional regulator
MEITSAPGAIPLKKVPDLWGNFKPTSNIESALELSWKEKAKFLDEVSLQNNVVIFIMNPYTNRYLYMSDKLKVLSGIEASSYTGENGVDFAFSRIHPDQSAAMAAFNQLGAKCFGESDPRDYKNILLCFSFSHKNGEDKYEQVLQRTMVLEFGEGGAPALFISFGHYVGHIKKPGSIDFVISTPKGVSFYGYNADQKCIEEPKIFSDHEKKIVSLLAQGDDTKTIAQKLFISPHTVDTHRRNLIKKTNCIDTTGVVAFARLINLI